MWKKVKTFFFWLETPAAISVAIEKEKIDYLEEIFKFKPQWINRFDSLGHFTPLAMSLLYRKNRVTLFLLQNNADPNMYYGCGKHCGTCEPILQLAIQRDDASTVQLLVLFGAKPDTSKLRFSPLNQQVTKTLVNQWIRKKQQMDLLDQSHQWQELSQQWLDLASQEPLAIYKNYYLEQSLLNQYKIGLIPSL